MTACLIAIAPNGARKTRQDHANIPLTAEELGETAKACMEAGAGMIHLHVRDEQQGHSLSVARYKQAMQQVASTTQGDLFVQLTSEAVGIYSPQEQFAMIHALKPEGVSIGLREIWSLDDDEIKQHFEVMKRNSVRPQLILYNAHDVGVYVDWLERGVLPGKAYPVLLVVGKPQKEGMFEKEGIQKEWLETLPVTSWMVCAFGQQEFSVGCLAAKEGGHVRLGFENNDCLENGERAEDNAALVTQMVEYLREEGIETASGEVARRLMRPDW